MFDNIAFTMSCYIVKMQKLSMSDLSIKGYVVDRKYE